MKRLIGIGRDEFENPLRAAAAELSQVEEMLRKECDAAVALLYKTC